MAETLNINIIKSRVFVLFITVRYYIESSTIQQLGRKICISGIDTKVHSQS